MRISDWSSDVCSSDLGLGRGNLLGHVQVQHGAAGVLALQLVLQLQGLEGVVGEADRQLRGVGVVRRLGRTRLEAVGEALAVRSEERRVGKGCVSTCSTRGSAYHYKKKKEKTKQ